VVAAETLNSRGLVFAKRGRLAEEAAVFDTTGS
jgi:hypothetical protein